MMEINFELEKETKNTVRFSEVVEGDAPMIGSLYIQKTAYKELGDPKGIKVTVEKSS